MNMLEVHFLVYTSIRITSHSLLVEWMDAYSSHFCPLFLFLIQKARNIEKGFGRFVELENHAIQTWLTEMLRYTFALEQVITFFLWLFFHLCISICNYVHTSVLIKTMAEWWYLKIQLSRSALKQTICHFDEKEFLIYYTSYPSDSITYSACMYECTYDERNVFATLECFFFSLYFTKRKSMTIFLYTFLF